MAVDDKALDIGAMFSLVQDDRAGAAVVFTGMVRNHAPGKSDVTHLKYEAYESHVVDKIEAICAEARQLWDVLHIAVEHRVGTVLLGELSVVVAISSPHRAESFSAGQFIIDELKRRAPIWKKEHAAEGAHWVQGA